MRFVVLAALLGVVAWDFLAATTFTGDDHLFLTFARHAESPLEPFAADRHGGEYYRPVPMALWWLLARAGGERETVFALFSLALHATAAWLTGRLARAIGLGAGTATVAAVIFLVAPAEREAALWFSASTDLLATVMVLGSILCLLRGTRWAWLGSMALAALAYLSKESALVLPALAALALALRSGPRAPASATWPRWLLQPVPHAALACAYLLVRHGILGGIGGAGDDVAAWWVRAVQIASGLVHGLIGERFAPQAVLWTLGTAGLLWGAWAALRAHQAHKDRQALFPLFWILIALVPLSAAGWVVGTRYFYLPAVGLALLVARPLSAPGRSPAGAIVVVGLLLALGSVGAITRRAEVIQYRARVAAAAEAVATAMPRGHRLFHIRSGIKDLDLVLKGRPALRAQGDLLIVPDVPASFVLMPDMFAERTRFLLASPPLPPSGAYRFGRRAVVGLARRHESPDLDLVVARLPELRFIELRSDARGGVTWRDVTDSKR